MKHIITFALTAMSIVATAQQKYYSFEWKDKIGVVNHYTEEVLLPTYAWENYVVNEHLPYMMFIAEDGKALIVNKFSGEQEVLDFTQPVTPIELNNKEHLLINKDNHSFLMEIENYKNRLQLPKVYKDVWNTHKYLIAFEKDRKYPNNNVAEILKKDDFEVVQQNIKVKNVYDYLTTKKQYIYAIVQDKQTSIFDENFKLLGKIPKSLEYSKIPDQIKKKLGITLLEERPISTLAEAGSYRYPSLDIERRNDFITFGIALDENHTEPLFKMKSGNFKIYSDRQTAHIELRNGQTEENIASFYIDLHQKIILLPQKYQKELGIEIINNSEK